VVAMAEEVKKQFSFGVRTIYGMKSSRVVALPLDWVRSNGLDNGSKVEMLMNAEGELVVKPAT
jgi:hypothetical protein